MQLSMHVDSKKLEAALNKAGNTISPVLRLGMVKSTNMIRNYARKHHKFVSKSNRLEGSIRAIVHPSGLYGEILLDEGVAKYGKYQHDGTRPHEIRAKGKQALHFVSGGSSWFVPKKPYIGNGIKNPFWLKLREQGANVSFKGHVNHPGVKKDQFLYKALELKTPQVQKTLEEAVQSAYEKAGLL
jgi:hypothetical protein